MQPIQKKLYQHEKVSVSVLRLDQLHPVVSGNKWFKLKGYLEEASLQQKKTIVTFGGAYSNHILATAAASTAAGFRAAGIIRGEEPPAPSPTLRDAAAYGMEIFFCDREAYRRKEIPPAVLKKFPDAESYLVPEGGYGEPGLSGIREIYSTAGMQRFAHILTAVGTGTTLAGLSCAARKGQHLLGISVLKNARSLDKEIAALLPQGENNYMLLHDHHFGGYAKKTQELVSFMNNWYRDTGIPSDFIYTGKMFFAADHLVREGYFTAGTSVLLIHTGGLQGNRSLPKGTLIF